MHPFSLFVSNMTLPRQQDHRFPSYHRVMNHIQQERGAGHNPPATPDDDFVSPQPHDPPRQPHCEICGTKQSLTRCTGCHVAFYCSKHPEGSGRSAHDLPCVDIQRALDNLNRDARQLGNELLGPDVLINPFAITGPDFLPFPPYRLLWDCRSLPDYKLARLRLVQKLLVLKRTDAVESALRHLKCMLPYDKHDEMGLSQMIPALLLRLGRDQRCYNFLKWFSYRQSCHERFHLLSFIELHKADVLERVTHLPSLGYCIPLTLLKIRLFLDLQAMQYTTLLISRLVPQEIHDNIRACCTDGDALATRILREHDLSPRIEKLRRQIERLIEDVHRANKFFWPMLLNPGSNLSAVSFVCPPSTLEEAQIILQHNYDSWLETRGAIALVKTLKTNL